MTWFLFSLVAALFTGSGDALAKKALEKKSPLTLSLARPGLAALCLLPFAFFADTPISPSVFWRNAFIALPFEILAGLSMNTGIKKSSLSTGIPYLAFTPVFLLVGGWIFLRERPTLLGSLGVLLVTGGAFLLQSNFKTARESSHPSKSSKEGAAYVLAAAFLFSITTIFAKKALLASSPLYFSTRYTLLTGFVFFCLQGWSKRGFRDFVENPGILILVGMCEAVTFITQFHAFALADVSYVIAIKRLSLLLSLVLGWSFFNEKLSMARISGALLMFAGAVLISLT